MEGCERHTKRTHTHTYTHTHRRTRTRTYTHTHMRTRTRTHTYTHTHRRPPTHTRDLRGELVFHGCAKPAPLPLQWNTNHHPRTHHQETNHRTHTQTPTPPASQQAHHNPTNTDLRGELVFNGRAELAPLPLQWVSRGAADARHLKSHHLYVCVGGWVCGCVGQTDAQRWG
jgi:hypothetical protein